jgi:hypothetical protein
VLTGRAQLRGGGFVRVDIACQDFASWSDAEAALVLDLIRRVRALAAEVGAGPLRFEVAERPSEGVFDARDGG